MESAPTFFTMPISHYCVAADRMLAFKGIAATHVRVPYHDKQALIAATGQDYVPALRWGGKVVTWTEIPEFLEQARPQPTLYPPGFRGLATVVQNWGHQVLEERVWRAVVTDAPRTFSDERERWVFEELQTRGRGPWSVLEWRKPEFRRDMLEHFQMVESMLQGREWILGEPSVADFGVYGGLSPWLTVGETIPDPFPALAAWTQRVGSLHA